MCQIEINKNYVDVCPMWHNKDAKLQERMDKLFNLGEICDLFGGYYIVVLATGNGSPFFRTEEF